MRKGYSQEKILKWSQIIISLIKNKLKQDVILYQFPPPKKKIVTIIQCWRECVETSVQNNMPGVSGNHSVIREQLSIICQILKSHALNPVIWVQWIYYGNIHIIFAEKIFATLFLINNQKTYKVIEKVMDKLVFRMPKLWNKKQLFFKKKDRSTNTNMH